MIAASSAKVKILGVRAELGRPCSARSGMHEGVNHALDETLALYREAVSFFIDVCDQEWDTLGNLPTLGARNTLERMCVATKGRPEVPYDFKNLDGTRFMKFPSYLRRDAAAQAISAVSASMALFMDDFPDGLATLKRGRRTLATHTVS